VALPRVYDIAKELGIDSKVALAKLAELGEFVKSGSSTITPPVAKKLREAFPDAKPKEEAPKKAPAKKAAAKTEDAPAAEVAESAAPAAPKPGAKPKAKAAEEVAAPAAEAAPATPSLPTPTLPSPIPGIPRPGNNPFAASQGMGIPRPVARPGGNNPFAPSRNGAPRPGGPRPAGAGGAPRPGGPRPAGAGGAPRPGFGGGAPRPGGAPAAGGGFPARPGGGPGGGRGRGVGGGTAGAFGKGGGKGSKARKSKRAKREEYEQRQAPSLGGAVVPRGDGNTVIRLRRGASIQDFADKIDANAGQLITVLFHLGQMTTATASLDEETFQILGEELGYKVEVVSPEDEEKELFESFGLDISTEYEDDEDDLIVRPPVVTVMGHVAVSYTHLRAHETG
jgi:translation initiation factor IF-2